MEPEIVVINRNVDFVDSKRFWCAYVFVFFLLRIGFWLLPLEQTFVWSYIHILHCASSFYFFHWQKGSPATEDQGRWHKLTWWEQIDNGEQYTPTRKFLTIMPICTFLLSCHGPEFPSFTLLANLLALVVVLIAKNPDMHKVRLFKINSD
eukprot:TRINITY_DN849_c0_g1_i1.p1 TRINITY_DN849_c0_g1~~TRINITY_DN849_c0_g1_i1.p1  ORF type:complete len:150 (-),score=20.64 TRINITY_DN849_c0_g1_i1:3-452(-)